VRSPFESQNGAPLFLFSQGRCDKCGHLSFLFFFLPFPTSVEISLTGSLPSFGRPPWQRPFSPPPFSPSFLIIPFFCFSLLHSLKVCRKEVVPIFFSPPGAAFKENGTGSRHFPFFPLLSHPVEHLPLSIFSDCKQVVLPCNLLMSRINHGSHFPPFSSPLSFHDGLLFPLRNQPAKRPLFPNCPFENLVGLPLPFSETGGRHSPALFFSFPLPPRVS